MKNKQECGKIKEVLENAWLVVIVTLQEKFTLATVRLQGKEITLIIESLNPLIKVIADEENNAKEDQQKK